MLAMAEGFRHTLASTGRPNRVIMLRAGSDAELSSGLARDQATLLATLPGVARDGAGRPLASAELVVMVDLPRRGESDPNNVPFRGVQPSAFAIRDELKIVEGRPFGRGVREVIVGRKAAREFDGLGVGSTHRLPRQRLDGGRDLRERRRRARVGDLGRRRGGDVGLPPPGLPVAHRHARRRLGRRPGCASRERSSRDRRFSISVLREPEYYAKQAKVLSTLIDVLGYTVAGFMAVGATFGALNCMYSAIASRQVEIATLRAIGFGSAAGGGLGDDRGAAAGR